VRVMTTRKHPTVGSAATSLDLDSEVQFLKTI
jgi:hypothetical protein